MAHRSTAWLKGFFPLVLLLFSQKMAANEGIWLPQLLSALNESEMRSMGMKMTAEDIYSVNKGSLKDAIVSFGGFCTGEIISEQGLLLTNHHCGFDAIADLSSLQSNWLENGFWAKKMSDELPAKGLTATFIVRIDDITAAALAGVTDGMDEAARQSLIDKNLAAARKAAAREPWQETTARAFYDGNQYFLFVTETFRDVRLVGAPPSSIGKFGADTDNWVYPRHTGDFSMFRIYAGPDNRPADHSPENRPYKPKRSLSISLDGAEAGDFTLVFGFPGRTQEYLPSQAIDQQIERVNPARIGSRDIALGIMDEAMRADPAAKLLYASRYASVANGWKKWIGESQGLRQTKAVEKRRAYEADFQKAVESRDDWRAQWSALLPEFAALYGKTADHRAAQALQSELMSNARSLGLALSAPNLLGKPENAPKLKMAVESFFAENDLAVERKILGALIGFYFEKMPPAFLSAEAKSMVAKAGGAELFAQKMAKKSVFFKKEKLLALLAGDAAKAQKAVAKDPLALFAAALAEKYNASVAPVLAEASPALARAQRRYMAAQMAVFEGKKRFYPDANSTLRVTYGQVNGFQPRDGVAYETHTYLDGVMEKYKPGDYEFDVPARLIELYEKKDFGPYAAQNGKLPVCFIGSNHTTGGNSGSPAIDANGNLIGLNFDRVWEGTMSDLNYDPSICRNIMVDARYILFIVDKLAGARNLIDEMRLVHPKRAK